MKAAPWICVASLARNTLASASCLWGLLVVGPAIAQSVEDLQQEAAAAPAGKPPAAEVKNYALTVTGAAIDRNGKPVPSATIFLVATGNSPTKTLGKATTAADGRFEFRDMQLPVNVPTEKDLFESGAFQIFGKAPGYGFAWCGRKSLYTDQRNRAPDGQLSRALQTTGYLPGDDIDINLTFLPAKPLSGRLVDDDGRAIENVKMRLAGCDYREKADKDADQFHRAFLAINQAAELMPDELLATSDADGRFEFRSVPLETICRLQLEHPEYGSRSFFTAASDQPPKGTDRGQDVLPLPIEMSLRKTRTVAVQVISGFTMQPVEGAHVYTAVQRTGGASASGFSDTRGRISLKLPPGEYGLIIHPPDATTESLIRTSQGLVVRDTAEEQTVDVQLKRGCLVIFKLREAGSGQGISGVSFRYQPERAQGRRQVFSRYWVSDNPKTNDDGEMRAVFAPGNYRFFVDFARRPPLKYLREGEAASGVETELTPGDATIIEVRLRRID